MSLYEIQPGSGEDTACRRDQHDNHSIVVNMVKSSGLETRPHQLKTHKRDQIGLRIKSGLGVRPVVQAVKPHK